MAAITSTQTGDWNVGATWVGGVAPGAGDTATIAAGHTVTLTANQQVDGLTINTTGAFVVNAGTQLTGMIGTLTCSGDLTVNAGCVLQWNANGEMVLICDTGGQTILFAGTSDNQITVENIHATGWVNLKRITHNITALFEWLNLAGRFYDSAGGVSTNSKWQFIDSEFDGSKYGSYVVCTRSGVMFRRCFFAPQNGQECLYVRYGYGEADTLVNCAMGYFRDGSAVATPNYGILLYSDSASGFAKNLIINATTEVYHRYYGNVNREFTIENLGYIVSAMLPGTGSALDLAAGNPGTNKIYRMGADGSYRGIYERSTSAKKTGDYGCRQTPGTYVGVAAYPCEYLETSIYIPITAGDAIENLSVHGRRHLMTDDCAEVVVDPDQTWLSSEVSVTTTQTNSDQWYEFADASVGTAGGSGTGMLRIVLRLKEYQASAYHDWADMTIDVGGTTYTIDFAAWERAMPQAVASGSGGGRRKHAVVLGA